MHFSRTIVLILALLAFPAALDASPIAIDFETLADGDLVTNQFAGLTFSNAMVLTAGISLNEFEFPAVSGTNVVFDSGGAISIAFTTPVYSVSGFFTYLAPLTLTAFDASNNVIGTVSSLFGSNLALSGAAGSTPNELLAFSSLTAIGSIMIAGDPFGGSFTLDNFTYDTAKPVQVSESSSFAFVIAALLGSIVWSRRDSLKANRWG